MSAFLQHTPQRDNVTNLELLIELRYNQESSPQMERIAEQLCEAVSNHQSEYGIGSDPSSEVPEDEDLMDISVHLLCEPAHPSKEHHHRKLFHDLSDEQFSRALDYCEQGQIKHRIPINPESLRDAADHLAEEENWPTGQSVLQQAPPYHACGGKKLRFSLQLRYHAEATLDLGSMTLNMCEAILHYAMDYGLGTPPSSNLAPEKDLGEIAVMLTRYPEQEKP